MSAKSENTFKISYYQQQDQTDRYICKLLFSTRHNRLTCSQTIFSLSRTFKLFLSKYK